MDWREEEKFEREFWIWLTAEDLFYRTHEPIYGP